MGIKLILFSLLTLIPTGAALLFFLEKYYGSALSLIDAIFLSISTITGTGISTVSIENMCMISKILLFIFMHIGGFGITLSFLFIFIFSKKISLDWHFFAQKTVDKDGNNFKKFLWFIFFTTLFFEGIGTAGYLIIAVSKNIKISLFNALFQSASLFCNVGLQNQENLFSFFYHNQWSLLLSIILSFVGGAGFLLLYELTQWIIIREKTKQIFSFTTRIGTPWYLFSIIITAILYFFMSNRWEESSILEAISFGVFSRGTGIMIRPIEISLLFLLIPSFFIGSNALSTGGGIKAPAFATMASGIRSLFSSTNKILIMGYSIESNLPFLVSIQCLMVIFFAIILSSMGQLINYTTGIIQSSHINIIEKFLSMTSCIIGNGIGVTAIGSSLTEKIMYCVAMLFGKILMIISGYLLFHKNKSHSIVYPEGYIIIH